MEICVINGHDYSHYIEWDGYDWSRNDIDSDKSKRTKGGKMRRKKITTKRKLSFKILDMSRAEMAALDEDLSLESFTMIYADLHGKKEGEFYCTSFGCKLTNALTDTWGDGSCNLIEV